MGTKAIPLRTSASHKIHTIEYYFLTVCLQERDTGEKKALSVRGWSSRRPKRALSRAPSRPDLAPQQPTHNGAARLVLAAARPRLIGQRALRGGGGGSSSPWRPGVLCLSGDCRRSRFLPALWAGWARGGTCRRRLLWSGGGSASCSGRAASLTRECGPSGWGRGRSLFAGRGSAARGCGVGSPPGSVWVWLRGGEGQRTPRGTLWRADHAFRSLLVGVRCGSL